MGRGRVSKGQLLRSAYGLTSVATHKVDIVAWFRAMEMPDTFYSWWLITELHIWMLCTRWGHLNIVIFNTWSSTFSAILEVAKETKCDIC